MTRGFAFCGTLNNPEDSDIEFFKEFDAKNCIVGMEVGESGTPHYQWALFGTAVQYNKVSLRVALGGRVHVEYAHGTWEDQVNYCSKDGNVLLHWEVEPHTGQGRRTDIERVVEAIGQGTTLRQLCLEFPSAARHVSNTQRLMEILAPPPVMELYAEHRRNAYDWSEGETLFLWGPTGVGKTEWAKQQLPKALLVSQMDQLRSFDPAVYDGIIFDDCDMSKMSDQALIALTDSREERWIMCRYYNGRIPAHTKKIFTHNENLPEGWSAAVQRRVTVKHWEDL